MDYKGFNIAMHELGHTVEQTFSLYKIDYILLSGVPNTAFTEAMAFIFQDRDLDVLGLQSKEKTSEALKVLDKFWMTREIAGVALVDMLVWRWLYEHEGATAEQLREAVVSIAKDVWNTYYAPVMNTERDSPLLAIYSHMIAYALYLPDYPLGHIIEFQIGQHLNRKNFGKEIERMCVQGRIMPEAWMMGAVGQGLSASPMLDATRQAVNMLKKTK
jgi:oligoendopeptidase F